MRKVRALAKAAKSLLTIVCLKNDNRLSRTVFDVAESAKKGWDFFEILGRGVRYSNMCQMISIGRDSIFPGIVSGSLSTPDRARVSE